MELRWKKVVPLVVLLLFSGAVLVPVLYFRQRMPRYSLPGYGLPGYGLLDTRLKGSAWEPAKLMEVLSWDYHANGRNPFDLGFPEFFDVQHQALLRLIDIQKEQFGQPAPPRATGGTFIDHSFVRINTNGKSRIVITGTGTLGPCHYDDCRGDGDPDGYWQLERFTFSPTGELLAREDQK